MPHDQSGVVLNAKALSGGWIYEPVVIAFNPKGRWQFLLTDGSLLPTSKV